MNYSVTLYLWIGRIIVVLLFICDLLRRSKNMIYKQSNQPWHTHLRDLLQIVLFEKIFLQIFIFDGIIHFWMSDFFYWKTFRESSVSMLQFKFFLKYLIFRNCVIFQNEITPSTINIEKIIAPITWLLFRPIKFDIQICHNKSTFSFVKCAESANRILDQRHPSLSICLSAEILWGKLTFVS